MIGHVSMTYNTLFVSALTYFSCICYDRDIEDRNN